MKSYTVHTLQPPFNLLWSDF